MEESLSYKKIWRVSYPIILGSIAQNIINVVDTAFLSRLGEVVLGAAGNSIIFYYVFVLLALGFAVGAEIIVGRRNGEKNYSAIGNLIDHCFYFLLPLSIVLFIFLKFFSPGLLSVMISSNEVMNASVDFMEYRAYGIFFVCFNFCFRAFYIGITKTSVLTWSTAIMAIVNIFFDYVLIFGKFGFPEYGMIGAAIASVIAEACAGVYFVIYTFRKIDFEKYNLLYFKPFQKKLFKKLVKISSPIMAQHFITIGAWLLFFMIIEKLGEHELAVSHIVRSIYMVLTVPLIGFSTATTTLVSNLIGSGNTEGVIKLIKRSAILSLITSMILLLVLNCMPKVILSLYTHDEGMILSSMPLMYLISGAIILFSITYTIFSGVAGTGKTNVSFVIETVNVVVYLVYAYWFGLLISQSLMTIWTSEFVYFILLGISSVLYLTYGNWKKLSI